MTLGARARTLERAKGSRNEHDRHAVAAALAVSGRDVDQGISGMKVEPAGAVDLHVHCGPEGIPRRYDPVQIAAHAARSGCGPWS